ncbi:MAG: LytTR family DNA-binding domain-containing protein [Saprospiraceae bacterium]|nr:LytTR family DNA-binding domain-containing protein [Saprospiraceae bacterium]MDW8484538.1 LytTR family DNA-binding domain-containing protein [Saprospiraceae bacterium]
MRCLIVEDEPPAQLILERYISQTKGLSLVGICSDAMEAMAVLKREPVDLMFLDIQMPEVDGLQFLKYLGARAPKVVLTTAYDNYALTAYDLDVIDYLVKPISYERFLRAVTKVTRVSPTFGEPPPPAKNSPYVFLKADRKLHKINLNDIIYIEGLSNYLKVFLQKDMLVIRETMSKMEELLPSDIFARVHKSYLVNMVHIIYIEKNIVVTPRGTVPIGESYAQDFFERIRRR